MTAPARSLAAVETGGGLRIAGDARLGMHLARRVGADEILWATTVVPGWCHVFLAATRQGACTLELRDDDNHGESVARVEADWPGAVVRRDDDALDPLLAEVAAYLRRPHGAEMRLPVDARGTPFQCEVWNALLAIGPGRPLTYGQVAQALGRSQAARAVGAACGANRVALVIPCHRVIGEDGKLAGYRWGKEMKSRLLEMERTRRIERESPTGRRSGRFRC